jgi:REP element-mobilizing transposase RayT
MDENKQDIEYLKNHNDFLFQRFQDYDRELGKFTNPGFSLNEPNIAKIVSSAFRYFDDSKYELHAYCVMSNHVHVLLKVLKDETGDYFLISKIVQSLKRFTANEINKKLDRHGQVWDDFYFDRIIRDTKNYANVVNYIMMNPVAAGLVDDMEKWRDSYFNPKYLAE